MADELVTSGNEAFDLGMEAEAVQYWLGAAKQGHIPCMLTIAEELLEQGDVKGARLWFQRAAWAGNKQAVVALGSLPLGQEN